MKLRGLLPAALVLACALTALATPSRPAPPAPWMPPPRTPVAASGEAGARNQRPERWVNDQPDTGQFLPDSVLLARVADRRIRVADYLDAYFRSYAEYRPRPDSAGRIEFLNSMINKDVLELTALAIDRPFGFEDRITMREHTQRVLSNVIYQRAVIDSAIVTEDDLRRAYEPYRIALHLRRILFADQSTAKRVRADLVARRISWKEAVRKYSVAPDSERVRDGDLGWHRRLGFDAILASAIFTLDPGEISEVVNDAQGFQAVQVFEKRPDNPIAYEDMRSMLKSQVRGLKIAQRADAIQGRMGAEIGMVYDTTNIAWASVQFSPTLSSSHEGGTTSLEVNTDVPQFAPADTGRVLARHRYGQLSLGGLMDSYLAIQPMLRPSVNDFESMRAYVDGVVLEPYMAELAVRRGLDRDPLAVSQIESKREEILVEHLYTDSISSKVWIRPEERRRYYNENLSGYTTFPRVTYAAFVRGSRAGADSLAARLRTGEKAQDLIRADSLLGQITGSIQERSASDHGSPYYKLLFEELRPGKVSVEGPDRKGDYAVIQLLTFDPGRQLSYKEVEHLVDESLQNLRAEELLKAFIARHRKNFRIEAHPELLGRVRLLDPTLLE